jgi:hypothetical protein
LRCRLPPQEALKPLGGKKEVTVADFKKVMQGLTDTTPTKDIVNAFKVFDKDVRTRRPLYPPPSFISPPLDFLSPTYHLP